MLSPRHISDTSGSALLTTLLVLVALGTIVSASFAIGTLADRAREGQLRAERTENEANNLVDLMTDHFAVVAGMELGEITEADIAALNSDLPALAATNGIVIDTARSGYRIIQVLDTLRIPHDEKMLAVWPHQPRRSYAGTPPLGGMVASRTIEVELFATVFDSLGARRYASETLGISQIPPFQEALYTDGPAELCANQGAALIGGPIRSEGTMHFMACDYAINYHGSIATNDDIVVDAGAAHFLFSPDYDTPSGSKPLETLTRAAVEINPAAALKPWQGRVVISPAVGGELGAGRLQSDSIAGAGECIGTGCAANSYFSPSLTYQRTTSGSAATFAVSCGVAWNGSDCTSAATDFVSYLPWPFASAPAPGLSAEFPANSGDLWEGLFPDPRREGKCSATIGGNSWETFRCPTNPYGFVLDLSDLPNVPGGLINIKKAINQVVGANVSGMQEVVLLRNGRSISQPLTIVSEIPVWIEGNLNVMPTSAALGGPPPLMIQAPRIGLLPDRALSEQIPSSSIWDEATPIAGSVSETLPLKARDNVTVYAVLRTGYCRTIGGAYFGGSYESIPAVVGDWSDVALRIVGSIQATDETNNGVNYCSSWAAPTNEPLPGGSSSMVRQPLSRHLVFDPRLLDTSDRSGLRFQPPGSYSSANTPESGYPGSDRSRSRQTGAFGGYTALRLLKPKSSGLPQITPAEVSIPEAPTMPEENPPLPMNPSAAFTASPSGLSVNFDATDSWDGAAPPLSYYWSFGDGSTGSGSLVSHDFSIGDDFVVTLTVTNGVGKQSTFSRTVQPNRPPAAAFAWTPGTAAIAQTVTFNGSGTTDPDVLASTYKDLIYSWDLGDGSAIQSGTSPTVTHAFANAGSYDVTLSVDDQRGGTNAVTHTVYVSNLPPSACFAPDSIQTYRGSDVAFDASCTTDPDNHPANPLPQALGYSWSFGDGTTATGATATHSYASSGFYPVTLTVDDGAGGRHTFTGSVQVLNRPPSLNWTIAPNPATTDSVVRFDATASSDPEGDPLTFRWNFGDGSTATGSTASHRYTTPGTYTIVLTVSDDEGATVTATRSVSVQNRAPTAAFTWSPNPGTNDAPITLDGSTSTDPDGERLEYRWTYGHDGEATSWLETATTQHVFPLPGNYNVTLEVRDPNGSADTLAASVTVANRAPTACLAPATASIIRGESVAFAATCSSDPDGESLTFSWDLGDGRSRTGATFSTTYSTVGTFTVTVTATDPHGATSQKTATVTVLNQPPTASFVFSPSTIYRGTVVTFDASASSDPDGDSLAYSWDFGNDTTGSGTSPSTTYADLGDFDVTLTVDDGEGGVDTYTRTVTVRNRPPAACFTPMVDTLVIDQAITFDAACSTDPDSDPLTFKWSFGDGASATGSIAAHSYDSRGTFTVELEVDDGNGDTDTVTGTVVVANRPPTAAIVLFPDSTYRENPITFDATASSDPDGDSLTYLWDLGDGTTSSTATFTKTYSSPGTYEITLTANDGFGGTSVARDTVRIRNRAPEPCFTISSDTIVRNESIEIAAACSTDPDGDALTFAWDLGDGTSATGGNVTASYSATGIYVISLTATDAEGASATVMDSVWVENAKPTASFTVNPDSTYRGQSFTLTSIATDPENDALACSWNLGDGRTLTGCSPSASYPALGTYTITLVVADAEAAADTTTVTHRVYNRAPVAQFTASPNPVVAGYDLDIDATASSDPDGDALTCAWDLGDGRSIIDCEATISYPTTGTYTLLLTVTDAHGATSTRTMSVMVVDLDTTPDLWFERPIDTGYRGQTVTQNAMIRNNSGVDRTICVTPVGNDGNAAYSATFTSAPSFTPTCLTLTPYEEGTLAVSLTLKADASTGATASPGANVYIQGQQAEFNQTETISFTVIEPPIEDPTVTDPGAQAGEPGATLTKNFSVTNNSPMARTYSFAAVSGDGAVVAQPANPSSQTIGAGATVSVPLTYTISSSASAGSVASIRLTATDTGDTSFSGTDWYWNTTSAIPTPTVWMQASSASVQKGTTLYSHAAYARNNSGLSRTLCLSPQNANGNVAWNSVFTSNLTFNVGCQTVGAGATATWTAYFHTNSAASAGWYASQGFSAYPSGHASSMSGTAWTQVSIYAPTPSGTGLTASWYNNTSLGGGVCQTTYQVRGPGWWILAPNVCGQTEYISARVNGYVYAPYTGTYQFRVEADDGFRLYVNGSNLADHFSATTITVWSGSINLTGGNWYPIQIDYAQQGGGSAFGMTWKHPGCSTACDIPPSYLNPTAQF